MIFHGYSPDIVMLITYDTNIYIRIELNIIYESHYFFESGPIIQKITCYLLLNGFFNINHLEPAIVPKRALLSITFTFILGTLCLIRNINFVYYRTSTSSFTRWCLSTWTGSETTPTSHEDRKCPR